MRAWPGALLILSCLVVTCGGGGCSAIIGTDVPAFKCIGVDASSCPSGNFCRGTPGKSDEPGVCSPCEPRDVCDGFDNDCNGKVDDSNERDICDGFDNDCNGKVDDGPLADRDGDGFTFCGRVDPTTGKPGDADCNDEDPQINPKATERCNGKDDDCDSVLDNGACPAGQTCAPKRQNCIDDALVCTPQNCLAPRVCDPDTLECITPNAAAGDPCTTNRACETGICGDATTLGRAVTDITGSVCTKPCCTSTECPREQVCFGTGAGGSYCVPRAAVGVVTPLGTKESGVACQGQGECRSGACDTQTRKCVDTCCTNAHCRNGTTCRFTPLFHGKPAFTCQAPAGTLDSGGADRCEPNGASSQCKTGLCSVVYQESWGNVQRCVAPCCGTPSCPRISYPYGPFGTMSNSALACRNTPLGTPAGDVVSGCSIERQGSGTAKLGAACTVDTTCESELCLALAGGAKRCTDVCCTDADCAAAGWVCRPTSVTNKLYLRCVPK